MYVLNVGSSSANLAKDRPIFSWLAVIDLIPCSGDYEFENAIVGGVIPKEYIPAVDNGIRDIGTCAFII